MENRAYNNKQYFEIQKAILFLFKSFANVEDKNKPELLHSLHVGYRLLDYKYSIEIIIAGLLHDVLEEGDNTEDIKKMFGKKVYELVLVNSKDTSIKDWVAQYTELVARIAAHSKDALIVKAADVLDNFIFRFQAGNELEKKKVIHLANQVFKHTDSNDRIFKELRKVYKNCFRNF